VSLDAPGRGRGKPAAGPGNLEVSLHHLASEIPLVHEALDELAGRHGLPARCVARLHLALEEHLANIIAHGGKPGPAGSITVRFALEPAALRVEIEDDAVPFNPLEAPAVNTALPLEEKPLGGLGIHLIRKSVDELEYRRAGNRNVLVMKNRLTAR
jgi:anti-sigma regulatory factor (Ser/Thr protein kinase)